MVYESMFGNTEQVARAVAAGLGESVDVEVAEVTDAPTEPDPEVALIVAGGPTHAFSMSRENTRADAINKGAHEGEREFGTPRSKACTIYPAQQQGAARRPPAATGMSQRRKRRVSTSMISTVPSSTGRSIGLGRGVGNWQSRSRKATDSAS